MTVGAKIGARFQVNMSGLEDTRKRFFGNTYGRVGLIVFQKNVVLGFVLFDQIVFQQQGICLRFDYYIMYVSDFADQHSRFPVLVLVEIRAYPPLQILRFPYIDNSSLFIQILVASGLLWQT